MMTVVDYSKMKGGSLYSTKKGGPPKDLSRSLSTSNMKMPRVRWRDAVSVDESKGSLPPPVTSAGNSPVTSRIGRFTVSLSEMDLTEKLESPVRPELRQSVLGYFDLVDNDRRERGGSDFLASDAAVMAEEIIVAGGSTPGGGDTATEAMLIDVRNDDNDDDDLMTYSRRPTKLASSTGNFNNNNDSAAAGRTHSGDLVGVGLSVGGSSSLASEDNSNMQNFLEDDELGSDNVFFEEVLLPPHDHHRIDGRQPAEPAVAAESPEANVVDHNGDVDDADADNNHHNTLNNIEELLNECINEEPIACALMDKCTGGIPCQCERRATVPEEELAAPPEDNNRSPRQDGYPIGNTLQEQPSDRPSGPCDEVKASHAVHPEPAVSHAPAAEVAASNPTSISVPHVTSSSSHHHISRLRSSRLMLRHTHQSKSLDLFDRPRGLYSDNLTRFTSLSLIPEHGCYTARAHSTISSKAGHNSQVKTTRCWSDLDETDDLNSSLSTDPNTPATYNSARQELFSQLGLEELEEEMMVRHRSPVTLDNGYKPVFYGAGGLTVSAVNSEPLALPSTKKSADNLETGPDQAAGCLTGPTSTCDPAEIEEELDFACPSSNVSYGVTAGRTKTRPAVAASSSSKFNPLFITEPTDGLPEASTSSASSGEMAAPLFDIGGRVDDRRPDDRHLSSKRLDEAPFLGLESWQTGGTDNGDLGLTHSEVSGPAEVTQCSNEVAMHGLNFSEERDEAVVSSDSQTSFANDPEAIESFLRGLFGIAQRQDSPIEDSVEQPDDVEDQEALISTAEIDTKDLGAEESLQDDQMTYMVMTAALADNNDSQVRSRFAGKRNHDHQAPNDYDGQEEHHERQPSSPADGETDDGNDGAPPPANNGGRNSRSFLAMALGVFFKFLLIYLVLIMVGFGAMRLMDLLQHVRR